MRVMNDLTPALKARSFSFADGVYLVRFTCRDDFSSDVQFVSKLADKCDVPRIATKCYLLSQSMETLVA